MATDLNETRITSPATETRGIARLAKAGGLGFGMSFLICCVLPVGAAALFGGAAVGPLLQLDNPLWIGLGAVVSGSLAWWYLGRREARAKSC